MYLVRSLRTFIGTNAERVAAGLAAFLAGDEFIETDTGLVYIHNGMAWLLNSSAGSPGGSDTQIQFNDDGIFDGDSLFTWNKTDKQLLVGGTTATSSTPIFEVHDSVANVRFNVVNDSASNASNLANIGFYLKNDAEAYKAYAFWTAGSVDLAAGSEDGYAAIAIIRNGSVSNAAYFGPNEIYLNYNSDNIDTIIYGENDLFTARIDAGENAFQVGIVTPGNIADFRSSGVVFNAGEGDRDFRIAGNGVPNGYFYDAGLNRHGFGTATPQRVFHIIGPDGVVSSFPSSVGAADLLLFENNSNANMALIGSATATSLALKMYKSGATVHAGAISYNNNTDTMIIQTGEATRFTIDGNGIISCTSTTGAFKVNSLTTTQRNALTAANSMIVYNTTTGKFQGRAGGAWVDLH